MMVWNGTTYTIEVMYMIAMQTLLHVTTTELNPLGKEQFCTKPKASIQSVSCKERHNAILKSFQQHFWGSEPDLLVMNLFFSEVMHKPSIDGAVSSITHINVRNIYKSGNIFDLFLLENKRQISL